MGQHATMHLKTTEAFNGQDGKWVPAKCDTSGNLSIALLSGELQQFNRLAGGAIVKYAQVTGDSAVVSGPAIFYGVYTVVAQATAAVTVYDNTAESGTKLLELPAAGTAANVYTGYGNTGVLCNNGIYVGYAASATGTLNVLYTEAV